MLNKLLQLLHRFEESLLALLLAAMTLVTFVQVLARHGFGSGAVWALELTVFLFAWLVLLGSAWAVRVGAHIAVDVLVQRLPVKAGRAVALLVALLCAAYGLLICVGGTDAVLLLLQLGIEAEDLPIPRWLPILVLPMAGLLISVRFLVMALQIGLGQRDSLATPEGLTEQPVVAAK